MKLYNIKRWTYLQTNNNRIQWIDNARGICMLFVIMSHTNYTPEIYAHFFSPFFLSVFFLVSGYLFHSPSKKFSLAEKLLKIVDGLLIPYLFYWLLSYLIDHIIKGDLDLFLLWEDIIQGNKLWFVACLIVSQLLFSIFIYINKSALSALLFSVLSITIWYFTPLSESMNILPWSLNISLVANFFIGIGYVLRTYSNELNKILQKGLLNYLLCLFYLILVGLNALYLNNNITFANNVFGNIFIFLPFSILGSYCVLYISNKINNNKLLLFVGSNSLLFYFFQNQILNVIKKVLSFTNISSPDFFAPILMVLLAVFILVIPINLTNKFVPIMTGTKKIISHLFYKSHH